jgi:hypothetical protein
MTNKCTCPPAISMATAVHRSNTDGIAQCGMSRATLEATGCWHRATTHSIFPQQLPEQQANKQQSTNTPKKLAVLMAAAMRRYVTVHIAQWRRFRALLDATKPHHQASIAANSYNGSCMCRFLRVFNHQLVQKGRRLTLRPLFSIGVLHIKRKRRA